MKEFLSPADYKAMADAVQKHKEMYLIPEAIGKNLEAAYSIIGKSAEVGRYHCTINFADFTRDCPTGLTHSDFNEIIYKRVFHALTEAGFYVHPGRMSWECIVIWDEQEETRWQIQHRPLELTPAPRHRKGIFFWRKGE